MVVERDESEFARLSQLGDILGLNVMEVGQVHKELAEQAFRNQVSSMQRQVDALLAAEHAQRLPGACSGARSTSASHADNWRTACSLMAQQLHAAPCSFRLVKTWEKPIFVAIVCDRHQREYFTNPCVPWVTLQSR